MSKEDVFDLSTSLAETFTQCPNNGYDILIDGAYVGNFVHDGSESRYSRARCARTAACVNALAGIPDPAAFVASHAELVAALAELEYECVFEAGKSPHNFLHHAIEKSRTALANATKVKP